MTGSSDSLSRRMLMRVAMGATALATATPVLAQRGRKVFLPDDPAAVARAAVDPAFAETQAFVFRQMWASYTRNVPTKESYGYPFTAMGWSYDWNPAAEDKYGVSEYIARQGAPTTRLKKIVPQTFCR